MTRDSNPRLTGNWPPATEVLSYRLINVINRQVAEGPRWSSRRARLFRRVYYGDEPVEPG